MNENQKLNRDSSDRVIEAFEAMEVPSRPGDDGVLGRLGDRPGRSWGRIWAVCAVAAAALVVGVGIYMAGRPGKSGSDAEKPAPEVVERNGVGGGENVAVKPGPEVEVPGSGRGGESVAVKPGSGVEVPGSGGSGEPAAVNPNMRRAVAARTLGQRVVESPVIVVARAMGFDQAPARGNLVEYDIHYEVVRVMKGALEKQFIDIRTPTAPGEFIGKEWILMLSANYLAGADKYASSTMNIKSEQEVRDLIEGR